MKLYRIGPQTKRLEHRALTVDDSDAFFALNSHPDVMRFTGEPPLQSLDEAREAIANYPDFETVGYGRWGCVLKENNSVIGFCGLKYLDDLDVVDIGYRFFPEYWGQGFATEAAGASMEFGFDTLQLKEIVGFVLPGNAGSIRVLEKLGMHEEGELVEDGLRALRFVKRSAATASS